MNEQLTLFREKQAEITVDHVPKYVTAQVLSDLIGISKKQISNLKVNGTLPSDGENKYNLQLSALAYCQYLRKGNQGKKSEMDQAKLEKIERENKQAAGELIDLNTASQAFMGLASITIDALESLPPRSAAAVANESEVAQVQAILFEEVRQIRETIDRNIRESELIKPEVES